MKYTSEQVNSLSYADWMETIAKELNDAGYKTSGYSEELHRFAKNCAPYKVYEASTFFLGSIEDPAALNYLKEIGLVNNGRCPMCGAPITGSGWRFTSGSDPSYHFQICGKCGGEGKRISMNPANRSGCLIALLLAPWWMIKGLVSNVLNLLQ